MVSELGDAARKARAEYIASGGRLLSAAQIAAELAGYLPLMDERDALAARLAEAEAIIAVQDKQLAEWEARATDSAPVIACPCGDPECDGYASYPHLPVSECCERPDYGTCEKCGATQTVGCQLTETAPAVHEKIATVDATQQRSRPNDAPADAFVCDGCDQWANWSGESRGWALCNCGKFRRPAETVPPVSASGDQG